ncbi:ABC transporter permease [Couchioplanes azureus]|uniref:ABC transporter permease n=1 Tax=Couchioplanes caeruleus TaxID=56438 RepID=UPI00166F82DF|nr:ABC transporter permease [Couchioplanes caeruleus]GGQ75749.1 ABC transporter permease [Couchioplanes caeruleus subsp. azureus]
MAVFLLRRLLAGVLTLATVSVLTFGMFFVLPRDPAAAMCPKNCDTARLERVRAEWGLDEALPVQYLRYVRGLVAGRDLGRAQGGSCPAPCLGYSYVTGEAVTATVARTLPVTVSIVIPAAVLWLTIGLGLGMTSALRRGALADRVLSGLCIAGVSVPLYLFGGVLLLTFVYGLRLLPYPQYTSILDDPAAWATALVLPWCTLALLFSAAYVRLTRAQLLETMSEDFVRTAEAKGLPRRTVVRRHVLRASITPLVTVAGLDVGAALGGTLVTETTFGLHGLGRTTVDAVNQGDLPMVMGTVLLAAAVVVAANLAVDVLYAVIDPRVRLR